MLLSCLMLGYIITFPRLHLCLLFKSSRNISSSILSVCNVNMKEYYNHQCLLIVSFFNLCLREELTGFTEPAWIWLQDGVQAVPIWGGAVFWYCLIDLNCFCLSKTAVTPASNHTFRPLIRSSDYIIIFNIWPCVGPWLLHISHWSSICHKNIYIWTYL